MSEFENTTVAETTEAPVFGGQQPAVEPIADEVQEYSVADPAANDTAEAIAADQELPLEGDADAVAAPAEDSDADADGEK